MPIETSKRLHVAPETYGLLIICLLDLISTVWLIATNQAIEGNPIMAFYAGKGLGVLVIAKILIAVLSLSVIEWARRKSPHFVRGVLRFAIVAYIGIYMTFFINSNILADQGPQPYLDAAIEQQSGDFDTGGHNVY